ncbi:MAG: DUF502 domain-containing protein [archaeon]
MTPIVDRLRSHATDARGHFRQSMFTGLAITVPLLVTLLVISIVAGFVFGALDPLVGLLEQMLGADSETSRIALELLAVFVVILGIFLVGFSAERGSGDNHFQERFDRAMGKIPGIGSVYRTFDEMSEMALDADTESFQAVKLVPFPTEQSYALGFVTAETPETIEQPTGHAEMLTLYVPMSPNPVMGGYVLHLPTDRCIDVDMTVEEGIKSIMTSGVATGNGSMDSDDETVDSHSERTVTGHNRPNIGGETAGTGEENT